VSSLLNANGRRRPALFFLVFFWTFLAALARLGAAVLLADFFGRFTFGVRFFAAAALFLRAVLLDPVDFFRVFFLGAIRAV